MFVTNMQDMQALRKGKDHSLVFHARSEKDRREEKKEWIFNYRLYLGVIIKEVAAFSGKTLTKAFRSSVAEPRKTN